jgi:outer membrane protein assembly factor BamB
VAASGLTAAVFSTLPAAAASYQDWPMFLQNTSRTNATTDPALSVAKASTLKLKWAFQTGGPVATSTSIVGTTAYVGSWDGFEYAFNTTTGAQIWKSANLGITTDPGCFPPNIGITSSASVVNGVVYVGGGGPNWYALNAATGATLWSVFTGDNTQAGAHYNWSSPLIYNGNAYIGIASNCDNPLVQGQLLEVSLTTHLVVNTYNVVPTGQLGGGIWTSPTLDTSTTPATIFVTTGTLNDYTQTQSQAIVAVNSSTLGYEGSWQLPFQAAVSDSDWGTTPTLTTDSQGNLLVTAANKNGIVYTWKRSDLELGHPDPNPPLWQQQIAIGGAGPTAGDGTIASGSFVNGTLYYAGGHSEINGHGSGGSIGAYNPGTGATQWVRQTQQPIIGSPAYVNGMIGYGEGNTFEVVNAANGQLLYSYQLPATTYGAVSVARSQFYVGDLNGAVYAFGLNSSTVTPPPDPNCPTSLNPANPSAGPVTCQDIKTGVAGSETTASGTLTVTASGAAIHGTSDQFRFLSTPVTGDSQSSVKITAQSTQNTQPQAGLMVRQSVDPTAPFYGVFEYPNDLTEGNPQPQIVFWYRTAFGGTSIELTKLYPAVLPQYIMIQRTGNQFSAGVSSDGVHYTLIPGSTVAVDMPATTLQGLAVDSGSTTNTGTASFTNLAVGAPVTTTMTPQAPTSPCPTSWTCTDVGNPNPPGNTTSTSATSFTLDGTGTGIGGPSDSFHYVYQTVSGDQALSAQVVTQAGSPATAQEGIMMRANASPTSPSYSVLFNPGGSATISWRYYDGVVDGTTTLAMPSVKSPSYVQIVSYTNASLSPPQQFFSTETSSDGTNWTPVLGSTQAIPMGASYLAGMAADAVAPRVAPPVVYNAVNLTASTVAPPGICPSGFTCSDIGINTLPGNQLYVNTSEPTSPSPVGVWTIQGSGSDIWSVYDNFRYEYQSFPNDPANSPNGDGTVSARVVSQAGAVDPWAKTGVMIRGQNGSDPQAPYYGVFVTPGNGVDVQFRASEGAQTNQVLANPAGGNSNLPPVTPIWVMAERFTNTTTGVVYYAGFTSSDGVHWAWIPGSTVALNITGFITSGIATDSHNDAAYTIATVDNLAQLGGSTTPPGACPNGWSCTDIGGALPPGQDTLSNGTWSEVAGGGDIWATADAFHLVSQTLTADGTVSAHVTSQQATNPFAKAGVMLRATTDPGSPYYAAFVTPGQGIAVQSRATQGASTSQILVPGAVPVYLKIARYTTGGQTYYSAYSSPNGTTWTLIAGSTQILAMTGPLLGGFGITSHAQGTGGAVTLDTVAVAPGELPPPGICPAPWSCTDVGGALPAGQDTLTNGTWSEVAGGGDIWGTADSFHLVTQALTGDGTVSAHVTSQQATNPWAKAGVMLRATTDPGSPYYAVFVTPAQGIAVQWRAAQGASSQNLLTAGSVPAYLRVSRYTTTGTDPQTFFSAFTSPDGTNWTLIPGSSLALSLPQPLLAGLAITSHAQGTGGAVTLDTVAVSPGEFPGPELACPSGWSCGDIGAVAPAGGQSVSGSVWTVQGGGPDIWGTADAFHFAWQSLAANGTVSGQVTSIQATDPWAKSGVMLRATIDPGSPYYAAYLTKGNGLAVQARTAQGVAAIGVASVAGVPPEYLQISRSGTSFTVSTSSDGVTWTAVPGSTLSVPNLSGSLLAGVAVSSHQAGVSSAVGFNAPTVTGGP